ncbi:MAG: Trp biosynthesis-associated membrane protein, partial [Nocardioidaceae bacterium]
MSERSSRRTYAAAVLAGVASGAVVFFAASRTWASVEVAPPGMTVDTVTVSGSSATPLVGAMAFVVMAGAVAVVASAGWLRRGIGVLVLLAGATAAVSAATAGDAVDDA